jgi:radical SAM protein with 4Fe4S-binding SPASM domain
MDENAGNLASTLPGTFILELTPRCNNGCLYCYTPWGAPRLGYRQQSRGEMSIAEIKSMIARLQEEVAPRIIGLSGGEPTLRDDLPELLAFIRGRGITPLLITNGTRITRDLARSFRETQCACEVTLLSHRREVHDELVRRRGARDEAVQGITNLRLAGIDPAVVFIATRLNYQDLYTTAELAIALGASALAYNRINLGAHNLPLADRLLPSADMIRMNLDTLEALNEKYGIPIAVSVVIEPCVVDVRKYTNLHFGWCPLAGAESYFTIDSAGNLRICNHSPTILGNLRNESFIDIYRNHPYLEEFRETWPDECHTCEPVLKALCKGGCKAAAEQCYGSLKRVDPFVRINREAHSNQLSGGVKDPV